MANRSIALDLGTYGLIDAPSPITGDFTYMHWLRFDGEPTLTYTALSHFCDAANPYGTQKYIQLYSGDGSGGGRKKLFLDLGGAGRDFNVTPEIGEWFHVAVAWEAGAQRLYMFYNGAEVESFMGVGGGFNAACNKFSLGDIVGDASGELSYRSLKWFDYKMTDVQIAAEMAVPAIVNADPVAHFDLNGAADLTDKLSPAVVTLSGPATTSTGPIVYPSEDLIASAGFFSLYR